MISQGDGLLVRGMHAVFEFQLKPLFHDVVRLSDNEQLKMPTLTSQ